MNSKEHGAVVKSVQDVTEYDPQQGVVPAKRINIVLWDGTSTYIVIPVGKYTKDEVEAKLRELVRQHAEVMSARSPLPHQLPPQPYPGTEPLPPQPAGSAGGPLPPTPNPWETRS